MTEKNPYDELAFKLAIEQAGTVSTFCVSPPASTAECVRTTLSALVASGHHIDNILNEYENILMEFRGVIFINEEPDET